MTSVFSGNRGHFGLLSGRIHRSSGAAVFSTCYGDQNNYPVSDPQLENALINEIENRVFTRIYYS